MNKIKVFSGFMSASIGLEYAEDLGFEIALGNEFNPVRCKWSREKYPNAEIIKGSFTDPKIFAKLVHEFTEKECQLGIFSPCCQPFSKAGKQHLYTTDAYYFLYILKFIKLTRMPWAWIENAREFQKSVLDDDPRTIEQRIRDELEPLGYHIEIKIQDAAGFYTAQHRRRTIILISRQGIWLHPQECDKSEYVTVEDAIGHLPSVKAGEHSGIPLHNGPYLPQCQINMLVGVPEGQAPKQYINANGTYPKKPKPPYVACRIKRDEPCNTIVQKSASITGFKPVHYRDNRTLTVLEIILLTGLPQNWFIPSWAINNEQLIRDVLGEAFAPLHVKALLQSLLDCCVNPKQ